MNPLKTAVRLVLAVAFLGMSACGGGGGGGSGSGGGGGSNSGSSGGGGGGGSGPLGSTVPPTTGPGDVEGFFPNHTGDTWYYDGVSTPPMGPADHYFDTLAVTGQKSVLGQPASVFLEQSSDSPGMSVESYYYKNDGGVAFMGVSDPSDTLSAAVAPYVEALFPVAAGTVTNFSKTSVSFGDDLDGDGVVETMDLSLTVTIAGFEPLNMQLGTFARTAHVTDSVTGTVTLSKDRSKVPFTSRQDAWAAPNAGIVKRAVSVTVQNQTQLESVEARGYVVNGVGRGLSAPYTTLTNLAAGNSDIYTPGRASLACDGVNCLVVSNSTTGVVGKLFDSKGATIASLNLGAGGSTTTVFDGTKYLVVVASSGVLRAHRVTLAGFSVDGATGIALATGPATPSGLGPAVALGSSNVLVVYSAYDSALFQHLLFGILLDRNGAVSPPGAFAVAVDNSTHLYPAAAFDGTNYLVVWQQQPGSGADPALLDIHGVRVSPAGVVLDDSPIVVSSAVNAQGTPGIAFDGTNYLVVWLDARNRPIGTQPCLSGCEIFGTRVTPAGALLDGPSATGGIGIGTGTQYPRASFPSVGFNGTEYLVVWSDLGYRSTGSTGVRLARVSTGGVVTSPTANGIGVSGAPPASTVSQYALPIVASTSPGAIVWLDNSERSASQKQLLAVTAYRF